MTALAPPDIEAAAVTLLAGVAVSVATRLPDEIPATAVRVTRTGGGGRNLIQTDPTLLVECYAADSDDAFALARTCYARLWAAANSFWTPACFVTRVSLDDPVNFPDPDAPRHARYQFVAVATASLTEVSP